MPARGGATMSPRCPLPIGAMRSITRMLRSPSLDSSRSRPSGYRGRRLSNAMRAFAASGSPPFTRSTFRSARYRSHSFGGRTWPAHGVARAQIESLDLRRRDVDVVRAVEVVPVLTAQESVALGQHLEHALAHQGLLGVEQLLLDLEQQIVPAERIVLDDGEGVRHIVQLWHRLSLELSDVHECDRARGGSATIGGHAGGGRNSDRRVAAGPGHAGRRATTAEVPCGMGS